MTTSCLIPISFLFTDEMSLSPSLYFTAISGEDKKSCFSLSRVSHKKHSLTQQFVFHHLQSDVDEIVTLVSKRLLPSQEGMAFLLRHLPYHRCNLFVLCYFFVRR
jgi:hypothetical protein